MQFTPETIAYTHATIIISRSGKSLTVNSTSTNAIIRVEEATTSAGIIEIICMLQGQIVLVSPKINSHEG